ncbi:NAD(P)H-dependent oxidoreductase [Streptomyces sp. NPDC088357]|uniref:NADPH-dependent FMN reductase n=1 Tax=Streptomyces sp. NPDC088357 TaxID=3154655 RepID=UPI00341F4A1D
MDNHTPTTPEASPTPPPIRVLALGGSIRPHSSSGLALARTAAMAELCGATVSLLTGRDLVLPMYEPDSAARSAEARRLLAGVRAADALLLCSPGYHGTVSGLVKNALDHLEELRQDDRPYLDGMPVGCITVAHGWQAAVGTLHTLRATVHALRGWPTPLGVAVNGAATSLDGDERATDPGVLGQLSQVAAQVVDFARTAKSVGLAREPTAVTAGGAQK